MQSHNSDRKLEHVVYILGAGFSAPLGIPVMANFLDRSKDMLALHTEKYAHFNNVFKTIDTMFKAKGYYDANLFNIEEILSILEMKEEIGGEDEKSLFIQYILDVIDFHTPKFKAYARDRIQNWWDYVFGHGDLIYYGYFVGTLLNLNLSINNESDVFCLRMGENQQTTRYSVITLNYDMVLENCFSYLQEHFHAASYLGFSYDIESNDQDFRNRTHLAKLHGSIQSGSIVPPTWNKGLHTEIKPAWQLAYKLLTSANQIRILGYSLPIADAYIKYLLKAAIIKCDHLRQIDVICRDFDGSIRQRYQEFISFPNFRFKRRDIKEYLRENSTKISRGGTSTTRMNYLEEAHAAFMKKGKNEVPII